MDDDARRLCEQWFAKIAEPDDRAFAVFPFLRTPLEGAIHPVLELTDGLLGVAYRLRERVAELTMKSALLEASGDVRPALAVAPNGSIVHANRPGQAVLRDGRVVRERSGRITAARPRDDGWLRGDVLRAAEASNWPPAMAGRSSRSHRYRRESRPARHGPAAWPSN